MVSSSPLAAATLDAIVFAAEPTRLFITVDEATSALRWPVLRDDEGKVFQINDLALRAGALRQLTNGAELVSTDILAEAGAAVSQLDENGRLRAGRFVGSRSRFPRSGWRSASPGSNCEAGRVIAW